MKFGTWNVRAASLTAAAREFVRYKLDLVGVQEVRWDKGGMVRAVDYNFFYAKGNKNHQLGTGFFVHHIIISCDKLITCPQKSYQLWCVIVCDLETL